MKSLKPNEVLQRLPISTEEARAISKGHLHDQAVVWNTGEQSAAMSAKKCKSIY